MKVILHLTQSCNLRCKYCYAASGPEKNMSLATGKKGIDLAIDQAIGSACISYFGGEPLLVWDMIKELTPYAQEKGEAKGLSMHYRLSTNGILFTEEILQFCKDYNILFAVSMDGNKESHDTGRILPTGQGSFDLLEEKIDLMLVYNPYTVFTFVITPHNARYLFDSVNYMWDRGLRYVAHSPDFTHPDWDREHFDLLAEQYEKVADWYLEKTRSGTYFFMNLFDDKIKTHAKSPAMPGEICDFGARKVSVAHDGSIFPCVRFVSNNPDSQNYQIGHVDTGFTGKREALISLNAQARPDCEGCALLGRCANYCGCTNWNTTGDIIRVSPLLCEYERMLIPIADRIGNILWEERDPSFLAKHYKISAKHFPLQAGYSVD
ncbi:radical SAM protein [Myxococcota bacterium]|nr:radical SAM protein [Myxococcota bacterium]MBU1537852.1 radical SAM protein [Myxococcota bacterium]